MLSCKCIPHISTIIVTMSTPTHNWMNTFIIKNAIILNMNVKSPTQQIYSTEHHKDIYLLIIQNCTACERKIWYSVESIECLMNISNIHAVERKYGSVHDLNYTDYIPVLHSLFNRQRLWLHDVTVSKFRLIWFCFMVFNATFNNISVISLVEETGVLGEKHRLAASHWQTLSHNVVPTTIRPRRPLNVKKYNESFHTMK